jgi:sulfur-oxidizing protein SoxY
MMGKADLLYPVSRRALLRTATLAGLGLAGDSLTHAQANADEPDETALIRQFVGGTATESTRVHVQMPAVFSNGYSVPLTLLIDSPMTESDRVRMIHVLAPRNPIIPVASFAFTPLSGQAKVSTRIRLAETQDVLAIAEMNDGTLLLGRARTKVDIDGCK